VVAWAALRWLTPAAAAQPTEVAGAPAGDATAPAFPGAAGGWDFGGGSGWKFVPQLTAIATYDDNVFIAPRNHVGDSCWQLAPGLAFGWGDFRGQVAPFDPIPHFLAQTGEEDLPRANFLYVEYTPDFELFTRLRHQDTVNQDVRLSGQEQAGRWRTQADFRYQAESSPDPDVGARAKQTYYNANLAGTYELTGKLAGGLQAHVDRSVVSGGVPWQQGRVGAYADLEDSDRTTVGFGVAIGDLEVQREPDQLYLEPALRWKYALTSKIWFTGDAGADLRHFGRGVGERSEAIFDAGASYAATESTTVTLSGRRDTIASVEYRGVDITESVAQAGVSQRVWAEVILTGTAGAVWDDYRPFDPAIPLSRHDRYFFYKAAVGHDVTKHGTVQLSYEHRANNSSSANFEFVENLVSLDVSFLF